MRKNIYIILIVAGLFSLHETIVLAQQSKKDVKGDNMKRILFVVTSHSELGSTGRKTGFYLPEVAHPYKVLSEKGFAVDMASPKGGAAPIDGMEQADEVSRAARTGRPMSLSTAVS